MRARKSHDKKPGNMTENFKIKDMKHKREPNPNVKNNSMFYLKIQISDHKECCLYYFYK